MFTSKSKINEPGAKPVPDISPTAPSARKEPAPAVAAQPAPKKAAASPSILSADLFVKGNLKSASDIMVEGKIEGDIRARLLTIGENATVNGHMVAEEVVVDGRVIGEVRGLRVRLNSTARVEGNIIHETISIESGAQFEGQVKRQENPLNVGTPQPPQKGQNAAQNATTPPPSAAAS